MVYEYNVLRENQIQESFNLLSKEVEESTRFCNAISVLVENNILLEDDNGNKFVNTAKNIGHAVVTKVTNICKSIAKWIKTVFIPKVNEVLTWINSNIVQKVLKFFDPFIKKVESLGLKPFNLNDEDFEDDFEDFSEDTPESDNNQQGTTESAAINEGLGLAAATIALKKIVKKYCIGKLFERADTIITCKNGAGIEIEMYKDLINMIKVLGDVLIHFKDYDNMDPKDAVNAIEQKMSTCKLFGVNFGQVMSDMVKAFDNLDVNDKDYDNKEKQILYKYMSDICDGIFSHVEMKVAGEPVTLEKLGVKYLVDNTEAIMEKGREEAVKYSTHVVMVHFYRMCKDKVEINTKNLVSIEHMMNEVAHALFGISDMVEKTVSNLSESQLINIMGKVSSKAINFLQAQMSDLNNSRKTNTEQTKLALQAMMEAEKVFGDLDVNVA